MMDGPARRQSTKVQKTSVSQPAKQPTFMLCVQVIKQRKFFLYFDLLICFCNFVAPLELFINENRLFICLKLRSPEAEDGFREINYQQ